jgi:hypothetical protein
MLAHIAGLPLEEVVTAAVAGGVMGIAGLRQLARKRYEALRRALVPGARRTH